MLKRVIITLILILEVLILAGCGDDNKLYKSVRVFADKNCQDGKVVEVALSDLTDFDWDEALVYRLLMSNDAIEDALGIKYEKYLDLSSGIIFVKDKKIVYEETFNLAGFDPPKFSILAYRNSNGKPKVRVFSRDSIFECYRYGLIAKE
ncbi:MAG: hypothetical protein FWG40_11890 [Peptococcaceae bacterium]|nr:hypothetical protein [Peptococcaceae bacterium]